MCLCFITYRTTEIKVVGKKIDLMLYESIFINYNENPRLIKSIFYPALQVNV